MSRRSPPHERIAGAKAASEAEILGLRNVCGIGVGYKVTGGRRTRTRCITVVVERKVPLDELSRADRVPARIQGIPTDVVERGGLPQLLRARHRPVLPGLSIGHYRSTFGTLGAILRDRPTGRLFVLSAGHVLTNDWSAVIGDPILQPGPLHGGRHRTDRVARLSKYLPPDLNPDDHIDAAIAELADPGLYDPKAPPTGGIDVKGIGREPDAGARVVKVGAATGLTRGEVLATGYTVELEDGRLARDTIAVSLAADLGDSGALVLTRTGRAIGIVTNVYLGDVIVTPIRRIIAAMNRDLGEGGSEACDLEVVTSRPG